MDAVVNSSESTSCNVTRTDEIPDSIHFLMQKIFYFVAITVTGPANVIVITSLWKDASSETCGFNTYAIAMAFTDLLVGIILVPIFTAKSFKPEWYLDTFSCGVVMVLDHGLTSVSIYLFLAMAYDRYHCVSTPLQYRSHFSRHRVLLNCATIWCIGFLVWTPFVVLSSLEEDCTDLCGTFTDFVLVFKITPYNIIHLILVYYIPIVSLVILNSALLFALHRQLANNAQLIKTTGTLRAVKEGKDIQKENYVNTITCNRTRQFSQKIDFSQVNGRDAHLAVNGVILSTEDNLTKTNCRDSIEPTNRIGHCSENSPIHVSNRNTPKRPKRNSRTRNIVLMVTAFLLCWLPYCVVWPLHEICAHCLSTELILYLYDLPYAQSAVNPLILILTCRSIRYKILSVFKGSVK